MRAFSGLAGLDRDMCNYTMYPSSVLCKYLSGTILMSKHWYNASRRSKPFRLVINVLQFEGVNREPIIRPKKQLNLIDDDSQSNVARDGRQKEISIKSERLILGFKFIYLVWDARVIVNENTRLGICLFSRWCFNLFHCNWYRRWFHTQLTLGPWRLSRFVFFWFSAS